MTFIAGGYTPPKNIPVKNLRMIADAGPLENKANAALLAAANKAQIAMNRRELTMSGRLKMALMRYQYKSDLNRKC
jgi:hypothetical protein